MKLYHVVGMSQNRVIGKDNTLPWHFSEDLKNFKELTSGSTVIMGRSTYESIGKPLPNRQNIVLSKTSTINCSKVTVCKNILDAYKAVENDLCFIIGGSTIYEQTMNDVDGVYLTLIHKDYDGDTFYPELPDFMVEDHRMVLREEPLIEAIRYLRKY